MRHYPPRAPRSPAGHWSANRDRAAQARFRQALIDRANNQCEWVTTDGLRCPATTRLQAHHTQPGNDNPTTGMLLCTAHHKLVDRHAR